MLLFSRVMTLRGSPRQVMPWATEVTEHVGQKTGLELTLWSGGFGYPVGSLAWSTWVEGRAQLSEATSSLLDDDAYMDLIEKVADMVVAPAQDHLRQLIQGEPGDGPPPVGSVAGIITATAAPGRLTDAIGWGAETAQYAGTITDARIGFFADAYGTFGQLTWIMGMADMAAADAASEAMMNDAEYADRIKAGGDLFVAGSGHQGLVARIA